MNQAITLAEATLPRLLEYFQAFEADPDLFADMSRFSPYRYDPAAVERAYLAHKSAVDRRDFLIFEGESPVGELILKHIDEPQKTCELSIHLQNDLVKNRGIGTRAEKLALALAFGPLGMETVYADTIHKNARSRHVLEKVGFRFTGEDDTFRYYEMTKNEWRAAAEREARPVKAIRLTWHGHSCFTVEAEGFRVVLDPYEDGAVPGLPPLRLSAHQVLCSHGHHDHGWAEGVTILPWEGESPFALETLDVFHDDRQGALRGANRIHVLEYGGVRVAHMGDLGHLLSEEQAAALRPVDALLIPVGGHYTIDAQQADEVARQLDARCVVPMHYRSGEMGYSVLGTVEAFLAFRQEICFAEDDTVEITSALPPHTLVMRVGKTPEDR